MRYRLQDNPVGVPTKTAKHLKFNREKQQSRRENRWHNFKLFSTSLTHLFPQSGPYPALSGEKELIFFPTFFRHYFFPAWYLGPRPSASALGPRPNASALGQVDLGPRPKNLGLKNLGQKNFGPKKPRPRTTIHICIVVRASAYKKPAPSLRWCYVIIITPVGKLVFFPVMNWKWRKIVHRFVDPLMIRELTKNYWSIILHVHNCQIDLSFSHWNASKDIRKKARSFFLPGTNTKNFSRKGFFQTPFLYEKCLDPLIWSLIFFSSF